MDTLGLNIYLAFISVIFQTNFICNAFVLDTTDLGKFVRNSANSIDLSQPSGDDKYAYRKLSNDTISSAFKGFLQIVDDPMMIKRSAMNYNIPDVLRSEGFVQELSISHLKNATLDHVFISDNDSYAELKLTFPSLTVTGWYNMTVHLDRHNLSIYGNGSFVVRLRKVGIQSTIALQKTEQGYTVPNKIICDQTLSDVDVKISNLLDDERVSALFSENLSVVILALHNSYKPLIDDFIGQAVMLYGKMLFINSKSANLETIIRAFAKQNDISKNT